MLECAAAYFASCFVIYSRKIDVTAVLIRVAE